MLGFEAIWLDYLEIDDKTGERYVPDDAPEDVKEAYAEYRAKQEWYIKNNIPMPK